MAFDLTDPIFNNEDAARAYFESIRWPDGKPVCPHCGVIDQATLVKGKSHRPGMYQCNACREPFTVTVGSVMASSHVPLHKWALAFRLMAASKKGVSAHQLMRMLGLGSYRTAWFMAHRVREAMADREPEPLGGKGKTVEIDETFIGKPDDVFVSGKGWQAQARDRDQAQGSHDGRARWSVSVRQSRGFDAPRRSRRSSATRRSRQHAQHGRSPALQGAWQELCRSSGRKPRRRRIRARRDDN